MLKINAETDISEARRNYEASLNAAKRSELTFDAIFKQYTTARKQLETSRKEIEKGFKEEIKAAKKKAFFGFLKGIVEVTTGILTKDPSAIGM